MNIFPPENAFEISEGERFVQEFKLRRAFVFGEFFLPLLIIQGRQGACDGFPFHNRKAGFCEPGDAANHNHQCDEKASGEQPDGHWTQDGVLKRSIHRANVGGKFGMSEISL